MGLRDEPLDEILRAATGAQRLERADGVEGWEMVVTGTDRGLEGDLVDVPLEQLDDRNFGFSFVAQRGEPTPELRIALASFPRPDESFDRQGFVLGGDEQLAPCTLHGARPKPVAPVAMFALMLSAITLRRWRREHPAR